MSKNHLLEPDLAITGASLGSMHTRRRVDDSIGSVETNKGSLRKLGFSSIDAAISGIVRSAAVSGQPLVKDSVVKCLKL